jgi:CO/xanthine dehydrogenase Mo-binding subunit
VKVLGTELVRPDAAAKATGVALYTEDVDRPGLLHGAFVRSPVAAGRIARIDASRAKAVCVLTADELPDRRWGTSVQDEPIVARGEVRYAGEPVALVAAETRAAALEAASAVEVTVEPAAAVVRLEQALADADRLIPARTIRRGDVDAAFSSAAHTVATRHVSQRVHQGYLEPRAALAELRGDRLVVTTGTQVPFVVRNALSHLLDLPMSRVAVEVPALGGGFGGKLHMGIAPHCAVLCLATGRPVRLVCTREEELRASNPRENSIVELETAFDSDGRMLARRARVFLDAGAYAKDTPAIASLGALIAPGPYAIEALDVSVVPVLTDTCPTGSMRGPIAPQVVWASESHLEEAAQQLGLDAVELRRRNALRAGDRGPSGQLLADPGLDDCLDAVAAKLEEWRAANGSTRRGYGIACCWWGTVAQPSAASVVVNEDGTATVFSGGTEIGTGAVDVAAPAVAAEELGLTLDRVRLVSASTDATPMDAGSKGSRTQYGVATAVRAAALEAARLVREHVAAELEVDVEDLVLADGRVAVVGSPSRSLSLEEAVRGSVARSGPIVGTGRAGAVSIPVEGAELHLPGFEFLNEPTFHCHGAEIELDEETGRIEVLRYVAAHDVGTILNPVGARGQVEGGVVQGLGYALYEQLQVADDGVVRNADLVDYRLPTIADAPRSIETIFVESHPGTGGPYGAKGLGEPPVMLPAAVVSSALHDLLGSAPNELPLDAVAVSELVEQLHRGGPPPA